MKESGSNKTPKNSITLYAGINKNGKVSIHTVEPTRNNELGRWESKNPYCNSVIYQQFQDMMSKVGITWNNECEIIEICYE